MRSPLSLYRPRGFPVKGRWARERARLPAVPYFKGSDAPSAAGVPADQSAMGQNLSWHRDQSVAT
jgi:hypothetical protein